MLAKKGNGDHFGYGNFNVQIKERQTNETRPRTGNKSCPGWDLNPRHSAVYESALPTEHVDDQLLAENQAHW